MEKAKMNSRTTLVKNGKYHSIKVVISTDSKEIDLLVKPITKDKKTLAKLYYLLSKHLPNE